jgi:hypothetical protein
MNHRILQGVHFLRVQGTLEERMRAHAIALRAEIQGGALPALIKKNEWLIRRAPGLTQIPFVANALVRAYRKLLLPYITANMTASEQTATRWAGEVVGLSYQDCVESLYQPDAMMYLARTSMMKYLLPEWIPGALPGCTSAVTLGGWTQSGNLLACRNLDYPMVGPWETNACVIFNEPSEEGEIPFVALGTAGVPFGGITSINREGITLFTHAHFGKDVSLKGRPIVMIGDEIIRKAKTLGQAVDIARKSKTCANWSFVMASAKENEGIVIEMTPNQVKVRGSEDGYVAHTNYFHNPELQKEEALLSGTYCEDLKGRYCRIRQLLEPHRGHLEPAHMSKALGDHIDYFTDQERVFGNTLSVITTVTSAVFDPAHLKFWMATRQESPVGLGKYVEIDIERFWQQPLAEYEKTMSVLPHYLPRTPGLLAGVHHYRDAYRSYHVNSHQPDYLKDALAHLEKAISAYPSDGHLWIQAGLAAFKLQEFDRAEAFFEKARERIISEHVMALCDLYLARCLDLKGARKEALLVYRAQKDVKEPKLAKAFRKGRRRRFRAHETSRMIVDLHFPDTFQY